MILNRDTSAGLASMLTLLTLTLPFASRANSSMTGAIETQLGHQGAHANISTGSGEWRISLSKLASVTITG